MGAGWTYFQLDDEGEEQGGFLEGKVGRWRVSVTSLN